MTIRVNKYLDIKKLSRLPRSLEEETALAKADPNFVPYYYYELDASIHHGYAMNPIDLFVDVKTTTMNYSIGTIEYQYSAHKDSYKRVTKSFIRGGSDSPLDELTDEQIEDWTMQLNDSTIRLEMITGSRIGRHHKKHLGPRLLNFFDDFIEEHHEFLSTRDKVWE